MIVTFDELSAKLRGKLRDVEEADLSVRKIVPIPVCYGGEFGPDLAMWQSMQACPKKKSSPYTPGATTL